MYLYSEIGLESAGSVAVAGLATRTPQVRTRGSPGKHLSTLGVIWAKVAKITKMWYT